MVAAKVFCSRAWAAFTEAGVGWCSSCEPTDCGAVNPANGLPFDLAIAASKSAISLVQGPAHALSAARASTAPTRAAVIPGLDIGSTPLLEVRIIASDPRAGATVSDWLAAGECRAPRRPCESRGP